MEMADVSNLLHRSANTDGKADTVSVVVCRLKKKLEEANSTFEAHVHKWEV